MKKFEVTTNWAGYSRGYAVYEVEAENEEAAKSLWYEGLEIERETIRDDTESEISSVKEVKGS
jgi:hypothetical protein